MPEKLASVAERRLLGADEVGRFLGVSRRTVYRLADAGRMPPPVRLGAAVRWDRRTLEDWLAAGCRPLPLRGGRNG
jgi:excisionase family DNA binding protein